MRSLAWATSLDTRTTPGDEVVVFGVTGNVGTALVRALLAETDVNSVLALARRLPGPSAFTTIDG